MNVSFIPIWRSASACVSSSWKTDILLCTVNTLLLITWWRKQLGHHGLWYCPCSPVSTPEGYNTCTAHEWIYSMDDTESQLFHLDYTTLRRSNTICICSLVTAIYGPVLPATEHRPPSNVISITNDLYSYCGLTVYPAWSQCARSLPIL